MPLSFIGFSQAANFATLNLPGNASTTALGGYNISSTITSNGNYLQNAALLADSLDYSTTVYYTPFFYGINHGGISTVVNVPYLNSVFIDISRTSYGQIQGYDASGYLTDKFKPTDYKISIGKSMHTGNYSLGAKINFSHFGLQTYRANALSIDLGGTFTHPQKELRVALLLKNIGFAVTDFTKSSNSKLPFDVQVGTTYKPEFMPFRFTITAYNLLPYGSSYIDTFTEDRSPINTVLRYFNAGGEFILSEHFQGIIGYNFKRNEELKLENTSAGAGFSFGFRIVTKKILIEYGHAKYHASGSNNQLSFTLNLRKIIKSI